MGARRRSIAMTDPDGSFDVVFGATGAIGRAVVTELVQAGRHVRAVSHGGRAPAGASVIYHCASPPYTQWPKLFPTLTGSILAAAEVSGAKLVFADNLY